MREKPSERCPGMGAACVLEGTNLRGGVLYCPQHSLIYEMNHQQTIAAAEREVIEAACKVVDAGLLDDDYEECNDLMDARERLREAKGEE